MTTRTKMEYRDPAGAFDRAIAAGILSLDTSADNYAGNYMYMLTINGEDQFKHIETRHYLRPLTPGFID